MKSSLLSRFSAECRNVTSTAPVLDLACGDGCNGLALLQQGIPVVFADIRPEALERVRLRLDAPVYRGLRNLASLWRVDLEEPGTNPLSGRTFAAILVFRYLHRPLMPAIAQAVAPGGLLIYETFTRDQPRYGRPTNPDYLLTPGELSQAFCGWESLYTFEGLEHYGEPLQCRAIAQLVARKPPLRSDLMAL